MLMLITTAVTYYLSKHDYGGAIEDYAVVIKFKPEFADAYVNRGLAYRDTRQT